MRDIELYLTDISEAINRIDSYAKGITIEKFKSNSLLIDGIVRNLEVIGEATKNIPKEFRDEFSDVEWKKMAGLRDILAHEYFSVDAEIIYDIVRNKLPVLKIQIRKILNKI